VNERLPALGPRGEGWVAAQLGLIVATGLAGLRAGHAWGGSVGIASAITGAALIAAGGAMVAGAAVRLGPARTGFPRPRAEGVLVDTGVYARVRHPLYVGIVTAAVGWGLLTASPLALALVGALALVLDLKARREEAWLAETYPDYAAYRARTHRFIPGVY
jgi:protein-S-isoprenylcysteine O-methyltransferase Ste14